MNWHVTMGRGSLAISSRQEDLEGGAWWSGGVLWSRNMQLLAAACGSFTRSSEVVHTLVLQVLHPAGIVDWPHCFSSTPLAEIRCEF